MVALDVSRNRLRALPAAAFDACPSLESLDVSYNLLRSLDVDDGGGLPQTLQRLDASRNLVSAVGDSLREAALPHHLVSITVDPENDTPPELKAYLETLEAPAGSWTLLTGDPDHLETTVTKGFVTYMGKEEKQPSGLMDIGHGGHLLLIDGLGRMRGTYPAAEPGTQKRIVSDIRKLAGKD